MSMSSLQLLFRISNTTEAQGKYADDYFLKS
jgi:hypothetical protein